MAKMYPFRFTHMPTGFSKDIEFEDPSLVSMMRSGHKPLQDRKCKELFDSAKGDETFYLGYSKFAWDEISVVALNPYDNDKSPA